MKLQSPQNARNFSERQHKTGAWNTSSRHSYSPIGKKIACFLSAKRAGVAWLAAQTTQNSYVCDLGCGNGAYSYWFLSHKKARLVAVDWSYCALKTITPPPRGKILPVCADACALPFKSNVFSAVYTIDTLGHVLEVERALDECLRIAGDNSCTFFHSECDDYTFRWPDKIIQKKAGFDPIAQMDGHFGLKNSRSLRQLMKSRFELLAFESPAGILGWLIGYPEKYHIAFKDAHMPLMAFICNVMAVVKKIPFLGLALRSINMFSNNLEILLGIQGGGSCFAKIRTPRKQGHESDD